MGPRVGPIFVKVNTKRYEKKCTHNNTKIITVIESNNTVFIIYVQHKPRPINICLNHVMVA